MEEQQIAQPQSTGPKKSKLWIVIVVIILVVIGAGAYFVFGKKSSSSGGILSSVVPAKLNPNCKYNDPDLCKFINNWKDVKFLTMNSTDVKDGKTYTSVFKMEGEDNSQITMSEDGKENYNSITLGKTTYTKDYSDNKWFKYSASDEYIEGEESEINFDDKEESAEDKTTYEKIGTEACGKLTCFKYKVIDPASTEYIQYIYFDNKDYQLRKTRVEMKDGTVSEATYDYKKFSIKEPSPVKEGNPYEAATGLSNTSSLPQSQSALPPATTTAPSDNAVSSSEGEIVSDLPTEVEPSEPIIDSGVSEE